MTNRNSLGTFDSSAKYTFKVNNDGSISHVSTRDLWKNLEDDLKHDMEDRFGHPLPF